MKCKVHGPRLKGQGPWQLVRVSLMMIGAVVLSAVPVHAEIKTIDAESVYAPGDNDSKVDARRIATQEAQRRALEQAGTFAASLTQVKEYRLTKDEVTAYTAGIVATDVVATEDRGTVWHPEVLVRVRCRIDTDVLVRQIDRYRDNEELGEQLEEMAQQQETLRNEQDGLVKQLRKETDRTKAAETQQKLSSVLTREEAIDTTNRVWAKVSPQLDFYNGAEVNRPVRPDDLEDSAGKLAQVVQVSPENQQARLLLAIIYEQQNDLHRAETLLRDTIARHPDSPILHLRLGIVLRQEKQYDEALRELHVMEKKRPNQPQMLFQTGLTHKAKGNCRLASAYMKRLLLYTRNVDRPDIEQLKPKARKVIESCGDQPPRELRTR
jgi:tetratricopeptide (TPR) repeat protein